MTLFGPAPKRRTDHRIIGRQFLDHINYTNSISLALSRHTTTTPKETMAAIPCAVDDSIIVIPEDVSSLWKSLDPAVRAALIESESKAAASSNGDDAAPSSSSSSSSAAGVQGRRALASSGPRIESSSHIGGSSFACRTSNPGWIKVRSDVYDEVKARREEELSAKVPVDIEVTLPDGRSLVEDKVRNEAEREETEERRVVRCFPSLIYNPIRRTPIASYSCFYYYTSVHNILYNPTTTNDDDEKTGGRQVPGVAHHPVRRRRHDLARARRLVRSLEGHVLVLRYRLRRRHGRDGRGRPRRGHGRPRAG